MANGKVVATATLKFGGTEYKVDSMPTGKNQSSDAVEVTSLADSVKQFIPGAVVENDEITVTLFRGESDIAINAMGELEITANLSDGTTSGKATVTVKHANAIVTAVSYPSDEATGDRKGTYDVTFRPDGTTAA